MRLTSLPVDAAEPAAIQAFVLVEPSGAEPPVQMLHDSTETLARPVFSPTRRPYTAAVEPTDPDPVPELAPVLQPDVIIQADLGQDLALAGVLLDLTERRALLTSPDFPEGRWFAIGDAVPGGVLTEVNEGSAGITSGDARQVLLQLYVETSRRP